MRRCCYYYTRSSSYNIDFSDIMMYSKKYSAIIIDVRSIQEYQEWHIDGAINIPVWDIKQKILNYTESKDQYIILYCSSGVRSKKAQSILWNMGFKNVFNVNGGFYS